MTVVITARLLHNILKCLPFISIAAHILHLIAEGDVQALDDDECFCIEAGGRQFCEPKGCDN